MTVKSMRRHADLCETEFRAAIDWTELERGDRVVIRPPVAGAPSLDNFLTRPQHQIESGDMVAPSFKCATYLATDVRLLSRKRFMLLGVHDRLIDVFGRSTEGDDLSDRRGVAFLRNIHDNLLSGSGIAHRSWICYRYGDH